MKKLFSIAAAALMMGGVGAIAAELPIYEVMGLPITPHQLVALGPAHAEQGLPAFTLTKGWNACLSASDRCLDAAPKNNR